MFVLWLIKRAMKPVIDFWNEGGGAEFFVVLFSLMATFFIDVFFNVLIRGYNGDAHVYFVTFLPLMMFWLGIAAYHLVKYLSKLYAEYRAEQPEKPKRKNGPASGYKNPIYFDLEWERERQTSEDDTPPTEDFGSVWGTFNDAVDKFDGKGE